MNERRLTSLPPSWWKQKTFNGELLNRPHEEDTIQANSYRGIVFVKSACMAPTWKKKTLELVFLSLSSFYFQYQHDRLFNAVLTALISSVFFGNWISCYYLYCQKQCYIFSTHATDQFISVKGGSACCLYVKKSFNVPLRCPVHMFWNGKKRDSLKRHPIYLANLFQSIC